MLNKYKITKQCLSTVLYIVFIISFSFYWECYWVWLSNNAYYYDWVEPFSEGFMDYNGFHLYDELTAADRHYFYYNDSVSWTWDISFIFNEAYYSKVWIKYTEDWYVWFLSWYSYADNIWFIKMSQFTNANNSQYANHYWDVDLSWDEQTEDVYWVWIDKRWNFHWKWKVESEPFYSENYNEWTTIWRPMPHDRDWDGVDNDDEDALISSPSWPDVDNDWIPNGENDWDSDWDWWNDWEERCYWSDVVDADSYPIDSDTNTNWLYDDFEASITSDCPGSETWPDWDCDWDSLTNREEQQYCSDPMNTDSDNDWLPDNIEAQVWWDVNDPVDWCLEDQIDAGIDTDNDWYTDCRELFWIDISYTYSNELCNSVEVNLSSVVLDMHNPDSDSDGTIDWLDINPVEYDIDWDQTPDWVDQNPLSFGDCNPWDIITPDDDNDWLPAWWEDLYTNWANNWSPDVWIITPWAWECESVILPITWAFSLDKFNPDSDADIIWDWDEDFDNDGFTNYEEYLNWTNPNNWDSDGDCISDEIETIETCLDSNNTFDADADSDWDWLTNVSEVSWIDISISLPEECLAWSWSYTKTVYLDPCSDDFDTDNDWLNDKFEIDNWLDPMVPDTDWDWVSDWIEYALIWVVVNWELISDYLDCSEDLAPQVTDLDWLVDAFEIKHSNWWDDWFVYREGYLPINWNVWEFNLTFNDMDKDSDNDDVLDPDEDFDLDWLSNIDEQTNWTDPNNWDSDWDLISDEQEVIVGLDPTVLADWVWDFDWDWLLNIEETSWYVIATVIYDWTTIRTETWLFKTSPHDSDSDNDWISDLREIILWLDPTNPDSDWDWVFDWAELTMWSNLRNSIVDVKVFDWDIDGDLWIWDNLPDMWESSYTNWKKTDNKILKITTAWVEEIDATEDYYKIDTSQYNSNYSINNTENFPDYQEDFDWDWLDNFEELVNWTDPNNWDSDWDLISDWVEVSWWSDPSNKTDWNQDSDWDWISNSDELNWIEISVQTTWDASCATWYTTTVFLDSWMMDTDQDGLSDKFEIDYGLDPSKPDTDWDSTIDGVEIALQKIDSNLWDNNSADPLKCWSDTGVKDSDNDGLYDIYEEFYSKWWKLKLWLLAAIRKQDGILTWDDITDDFTLNKTEAWAWSLSNRNSDFDEDWLSNYSEMINWTNPNDWDSDWDLISDFDEVWIMSDPNNYLDKSNDSDWDYITDANEINIHWTDPLLFDSDHDWLNDKLEISLRLDPNNLDSDWDKIPDWIEYTMYKINTSFWDPWDKTVVISDTDQDLLPDQWENYYKNWSRSNLTGFIVTKDWKIPVDSKHDLSHINSASVANSNDKIDSLIDFDWDWLVNLEELYYWTNPNNWDIDWDNISDKDDPFPNDKCNQDPYCLNWSRTYWDKDQDWISDELEINWWEYATKWTVYDSDWDGLSDWYEKENSLNPLKKDTTWDWLSDWFGKYTESLWVWTTWNEGASFLESSWETLFETYINKLFE